MEMSISASFECHLFLHVSPYPWYLIFTFCSSCNKFMTLLHQRRRLRQNNGNAGELKFVFVVTENVIKYSWDNFEARRPHQISTENWNFDRSGVHMDFEFESQITASRFFAVRMNVHNNRFSDLLVKTKYREMPNANYASCALPHRINHFHFLTDLWNRSRKFCVSESPRCSHAKRTTTQRNGIIFVVNCAPNTALYPSSLRFR